MICRDFAEMTFDYLAMKSVFEPYRDIKDNLHKDLTAKLLAADTVIKQTISQIFRSKVRRRIFFFFSILIFPPLFIRV